ncbi:MAG: PKD domain-containing protein, partial [Flavobacteriales bacterium]
QHKSKPARINNPRIASVNASSSVAAAPKPSGSTNSTSVFHASAKEACPGTPVKFTVEHMPEDGIYLWNFGDGSFSNKPDPEHTYTKAGSYEVMLSLSSSGAGTIHNKPSSDVIVVNDGPVAAFNVLQQEAPGMIPSMRFENASKSADTYAWNFGDGTTSSIPLPEHIFKKKGAYRVELTATSATGCVDRTMKDVHVARDHDLGAQSSFSPQGEGQGDGFMPATLTNLKSKFQLSIYDSAGLLLYRTDDAKQPWNGRVNNQGSVSAAGTYVWVVDLDAGQQPEETFTGQVSLVR